MVVKGGEGKGKEWQGICGKGWKNRKGWGTP